MSTPTTDVLIASTRRLLDTGHNVPIERFQSHARSYPEVYAS